MNLIRSRAPLRISFGGGGTDILPYINDSGGAVINATINKYAYGTLIPNNTSDIVVKSLDLNTTAVYNIDNTYKFGGKLDLVTAVLKNFTPETGFDLYLHCDAPPGSGLGSSSTVIVALICLLKDYLKHSLTDYEIAELAYKLEREDLAMAGGKQDQYASSFGGFNYIEFNRDSTIVNPLKVPREVLNELEYRSLLVYTGKTRVSANIIEESKDRYEGGLSKENLDRTKQIAMEMKNNLLMGDLQNFGNMLNEAWEHKKEFASAVSNSEIDKIVERARNAGAIGCKVTGAGGGGFLYLFCDFNKKHQVSDELISLGAKPIDFSFELKGAQTWKI
tara:strand:+ start:219 stop:1220 length:1002 start_codon:yes stop_codon:yes gene_type:complete